MIWKHNLLRKLTATVRNHVHFGVPKSTDTNIRPGDSPPQVLTSEAKLRLPAALAQIYLSTVILHNVQLVQTLL